MKITIKLMALLFLVFHFYVMVFQNVANIRSYQSEAILTNTWSNKGFVALDSISTYIPALPKSIQRICHTYGILSGAETGYGFFSPNVPDDVEVYFELIGVDQRGHVENANLYSEYGMKRFIASLSSYRINEKLKPIVARSWAARMLSIYPDSHSVTVYIGSRQIPSMNQYLEGKRPSFLLQSKYTFEIKV